MDSNIVSSLLDKYIPRISTAYSEPSSKLAAFKLDLVNYFSTIPIVSRKSDDEIIRLFIAITCWESSNERYRSRNQEFRDTFNKILSMNIAQDRDAIEHDSWKLYTTIEYTIMQVCPIRVVDVCERYQLPFPRIRAIRQIYKQGGGFSIANDRDFRIFKDCINDIVAQGDLKPFYFGYYAFKQSVLMADSPDSFVEIGAYAARYNAPYGVPTAGYVNSVLAIYEGLKNSNTSELQATALIQQSQIESTVRPRQAQPQPVGNDIPHLTNMMLRRMEYVSSRWKGFIDDCIASMANGESISIAVRKVNEKIQSMLNSGELLFYFLPGRDNRPSDNLYGFLQDKEEGFLALNEEDIRSLFNVFCGLWIKQYMIFEKHMDRDKIYIAMTDSTSDDNYQALYNKPVRPPLSNRELDASLKRLTPMTDLSRVLIVQGYEDDPLVRFDYANYMITFDIAHCENFKNGLSMTFTALAENWKD